MTQPPHFPDPNAPFALLREMAEAPALLRAFDPAVMAPWRAAWGYNKPLFVAGEGSSRIFPAKNLIARARALDVKAPIFTEGARQAAENEHTDDMVIGLSNSGRTRETLALFQALRAQNMPAYAVTADAGSPLAKEASDSRMLTCGAEHAVAASKSVIEQALLLHALLDDPAWRNMAQAADMAERILQDAAALPLAHMLAEASTVYVAGRNTGAAEEIALKSCEIARIKSFFLEGTYVLHGIEEVMQKDDCVVLIAPFAQDMERYQTVLTQGVGLRVIAVSAAPTPFPTLIVPACEGFDGYLHVMAGWLLLALAGQLRGIDIDKTLRARKVGNAV